MSVPRVTVLYQNGKLLQDVAALDGIGAIIGTGTSALLLGVPRIVFSLADAILQGYTLAAEPAMYRHLEEFYREVGVNQELHIMIVPDTMTLAQMVDNTNVNGAIKLTINAPGRIRLLTCFRIPPVSYVAGGPNFIDADVVAALPLSRVFALARLAELSPLRILIEGRVQNFLAANTLTPTASTNGFAGVVLGGSLNNGSASVGLALGRAVKYGAEVKLGKVANGPLTIPQVFIGNRLLKDVTNLVALHASGFITFITHPQKAGFFFGIDRMCSVDDYRLLAYGRIVDKAAVIAAAVYVEQLEDEVDTEENGNIASYVVSDLEKQIEQQINVAMGAQISNIQALINPAQNIINTSRFVIKLRVQPKGYKSFIDVELGLNASL